MNDAGLRHAIYRCFADTGLPPTPAQLAGWAGSSHEAQLALQRLHQAHALVLDETGSIRMALPFSAVDTGHAVMSGESSWMANCAWDTLAIPAALDVDASIEATWLDTGDQVKLAVIDGELSNTDGFIHFKIPARHWWDDIVET